MSNKLIGAVCVAVLLLGSIKARAEEYPAGNITAVVALAAGGSMDIIARLYGQKLAEHFGKAFIIDNRGAAAGNIAAEAVSRAKPDGRTLLVASSGVFSINGTYFKSLPYDAKDFEPIALYVKIPFILVASADSPFKSIDDIVAAAKQNPGKITFASTGVGLAPHLAGELLKMKLNIDLTHVPYRGSMTQGLTDVIARHVDLIFADPSVAMPLIREGKLTAIGASSATRMPQMPDLPTIAELIKAPDFEAVSWHVIAAPAHTPKDIIDTLSGAMKDAFRDPVIAQRIETMGLTPVNPPLTPAATRTYINAETEKWGALLKRLNIEHVE